LLKYPHTAILIFILSCSILISCGDTKKSKMPEGNIDVDYDIYIIPIGNVDEKYLYPLIPKLEKRFTTKVYLALDKRMPEPDYAYDFDKKQYVSMYILHKLLEVKLPEKSVALGVTNVDIFVPESDRSFLFGQANQSKKGGGGAIISMLRLDPKSYVGGKANEELLSQRMIKEAVHELGHVFGLRNSADKECVMYLPSNLDELDKKSDSFSIECQKEFRELKKLKKKEAVS
jgi:archaemetzincin